MPTFVQKATNNWFLDSLFCNRYQGHGCHNYNLSESVNLNSTTVNGYFTEFKIILISAHFV